MDGLKYTLLLNNNGIAIGKSICYIDLTESELEVTKEQYEQMNEFPLALIVEDGEVVSWKKVVVPVDPVELQNQIARLKVEKIIQSKQQLAKFLETHPAQYNGEYYSVTQEKQALLTSAIAAYQLKLQAGVPATLKWNTTGDVCREFTMEEIIGLVISITDYVQPRVEKQQALEVAINNCTTIEELDNIVIDYEVV